MALAIIIPADILRLNHSGFERFYEKCLGFLMRESEKVCSYLQFLDASTDGTFISLEIHKRRDMVYHWRNMGVGVVPSGCSSCIHLGVRFISLFLSLY